MEFRRLTTEELKPLAEEFAVFLASQGINKEEWDQLKETSSDKVDGILDIFSDLIFKKALTSCKYMERISETEMHTYLFHDKSAHLVSVRMTPGSDANFLEGHLSEIFMDLLKHKKLEITQGVKQYDKPRINEMFDILQTGAVMSNGELYRTLITLL